jgi:type II secretory pathway component GspD/PulD (secretin)
MQTKTPINTAPIERLLTQIKNADQSQQKQVTLDIASAKDVAYTLGTVLARLAGDYEAILVKDNSQQEIEVKVDGGGL